LRIPISLQLARNEERQGKNDIKSDREPGIEEGEQDRDRVKNRIYRASYHRQFEQTLNASIREVGISPTLKILGKRFCRLLLYSANGGSVNAMDVTKWEWCRAITRVGRAIQFGGDTVVPQIDPNAEL
jgi:hypothetical protein